MKIKYKDLKSLKYIELPDFDKDCYKSILVFIRGDFGINLNSGMETTIQMNGSVKKRITQYHSEKLLNKLVYQSEYFEKCFLNSIKKIKLVNWSIKISSNLYSGSVRACITESKKALRNALQKRSKSRGFMPLFF